MLDEDFFSSDSSTLRDSLSDSLSDEEPAEEGSLPLLEEDVPDFFVNLAETLPEQTLSRIAYDVLEGIEQDQNSRQEWLNSYTRGLKNLGFNLEDVETLSFKNACGAFDTTLSQAVLRLYSLAQAEMFPPEGPVSVQMMGEPSEALEDQAERVKAWMNWYLTRKDLDYYTDSDRLLLYLALVGCAFRKVFQDPVEHHPVARFIDPQDFIVNNECISVLSSTRLTCAQRMNAQTLRLRQQNGFYRSLEVSFEEQDSNQAREAVAQVDGIQTSGYSKSSLLEIYESHVHLFMDEDNEGDAREEIPKPYIVTLIPSTREILSIRRNWQEGDPAFRRIEHFVQYNLLPGFGLYGLGYARLLGSNAHTLTSLLRQLVDKGILSNFPGGIRTCNFKDKSNDHLIGPCEFVLVDTQNLPLKDVIMPLPYGEPSPVLKELYETLRLQTHDLAATSEIKIADQSINAPVGTTLAHMDVAHRLQSAILRSLRTSLTHELGILYRLFGQCMPDTPYPFEVAGHRHVVMRADFNESLMLTPVSDPSLSTSTQRIARVQELLRLSAQAPQFFDLREVYRRACKTLQVENIDDIMPPPQETPPLDPVTENMNMLQGKPATVALWQDHPSHLMVHGQFAQANPDGAAAIQAHMATHRAYDYLLQMEQGTGFNLSSPEQIKDPRIQNQIALGAAQVAEQWQQQTQAQQPPDPNAVVMADIKAKEEASRLKFEEAQLKAKTEAFKAQLEFEMQQRKLEVEQQMSSEKNQTALEVEAMKHQGEQYVETV